MRCTASPTTHGIPVAETQAGKGALAWNDPLNAGALGVTGSPAANALAHDADCVLAIGTRLQDFTTGSNTLFTQADVIGINANAFDGLKHRALVVEADARSRARRARRTAARLARGPHVDRARAQARGELARHGEHAHACAATRHRAALRGRRDRRGAAFERAAPRRTTSSSARPARCPPNCTSCGAPADRARITSSTAIRAWATRSPADSA